MEETIGATLLMIVGIQHIIAGYINTLLVCHVLIYLLMLCRNNTSAVV